MSEEVALFAGTIVLLASLGAANGWRRSANQENSTPIRLHHVQRLQHDCMINGRGFSSGSLEFDIVAVVIHNLPKRRVDDNSVWGLAWRPLCGILSAGVNALDS